MTRISPLLRWGAMACLAWAGLASPGVAAELPEYQLKAAFLYNFALFTDWPADTGATITLCVLEGSGFRNELEEFQGKAVGARHFAVQYVPDAESTQGCHLVFLPKAPAATMAHSMRHLANRRAVLVVGDSPETALAGTGINMAISDSHVSFDVNLKAVQESGLTLSSKLLRLARHVR